MAGSKQGVQYEALKQASFLSTSFIESHRPDSKRAATRSCIMNGRAKITNRLKKKGSTPRRDGRINTCAVQPLAIASRAGRRGGFVAVDYRMRHKLKQTRACRQAIASHGCTRRVLTLGYSTSC